MDLKDLRKVNTQELEKELKEKRDKLQELKFKISLEEHSQVSDYGKLKKDIAQILTVLNEEKTAEPVVDVAREEETNK